MSPVQVMHLCFPFVSRSQFESAARGYIRRFQTQLTIINSTVLPHTTRNLARATGAAIAYSPVRGKHARMTQQLVHYAKFISASDEVAAEMARDHFNTAGMKTRLIDAPETLELAKLAETTYFGVLIAFAQELNRYAQAAGADYEDLAAFFEEIDFLPRTRYSPGFIGGHCVIPNINLLLQLAPAGLLEAVLKSNDLRGLELDQEAAAGARAMATTEWRAPAVK